MAPSRMSISASSSDNNRQPAWIKAAHSVLLPEPGGAGKIIAASPRATTAACTIRN